MGRTLREHPRSLRASRCLYQPHDPPLYMRPSALHLCNNLDSWLGAATEICRGSAPPHSGPARPHPTLVQGLVRVPLFRSSVVVRAADPGPAFVVWRYIQFARWTDSSRSCPT